MENNTLEFGIFEGNPVLWEKSGNYVFVGTQDQKEWIEKKIGFFYDDVDELSKEQFVTQFGEEIIKEFQEYIKEIEHNTNSMIGGSANDNNNLKGDILKGLL